MKCVHCLNEAGKTKDHIIPKNWFPKDTPSDIQRYTIPSCFECNNRLGKSEETVLLYLGLTLNKERGQKSGVRAKVFSAFGIGVDENSIESEEKEKRFAKLRHIIGKAHPLSTEKQIYPLKSQDIGKPGDKRMVFPVPMDELNEVYTKIVKGLEFKINNKRYIESPFQTYVIHGEMFNFDLTKDPDGLMESINFGPEFEVCRIRNPIDNTILYRVKIFDQMIYYVLITDKGIAENKFVISDGVVNMNE